MNPETRPRPRLSASWNAGYSGGRPALTNVLVGASWSHNPEWPTRTIHLYLGVVVLSLVLPTGGRK
ncbi:hypothetical protein SEA_BOLT007_55 [Arthrobacter phage Bolt007]|uniref:Uncharacterized protein n=1 Tax=Arthrobacter phage Bolt007 TaxID=3017297 RepID=A0AA49E4F9_9CAUD|nr:hypothetical protein SEA_BOLT007_55 [Arthrobacter phage Bolt007]